MQKWKMAIVQLRGTAALKEEDDFAAKLSKRGRRGSSSGKTRKKSEAPSIGSGRVGMDYSNTYRENEVLDLDLEDRIVSLIRDESRALAEKGDKIQEARKEVEAMNRLQEAVNASQPGVSTAILHNTRSRFADLEGTEFGQMAKMSKTELRIREMRERFSAKNLFNRRTPASTLEIAAAGGGGGGTSSKQGSSTSGGPNRGGRSRTMSRMEDEEDIFDSRDGRSQTPSSLHNHSSFNGRGGGSAVTPRSKPRPKTAQPTKGYLRDTMASQHGRPRTAIGSAGADDVKYDDLLPPRSHSAFRSRSRRELEILSRIAVKDHEPLVDEYGMTNWNAVHEKKRRNKLEDLKSESEFLNMRVRRFITDLDGFNRRPRSAWK